MSLSDPNETRRARSDRRRPIVRGIVTAVLLLSSATAGLVWGRLFVSGFEHVDVSTEVLAVVSAIVAWMSYLLFSIATFGSWRAAPVVLGVALVLPGLGLLWARAEGGGALLEFPGWLGLLFIGLGVLVWVMTAVARRGQRRREAQEVRTVSTGTETTATVTHVPDGPNPTSRGLWAAVTFTFTDSASTQRWVERSMLIRREGDVRVGDTTRLWYDASDPGADARIVVELARDNPLRLTR
jgi:hypothetical protein